MIAKLDQIQNLNDQAKKNDSFKEKLHQTLRDYLSWKNQIFKQNFIQNQPSDVDYSKLFNCNKKRDDDDDCKDGKHDTEPSMDTNKAGGGEPHEKSTINNEISNKMRN